MLIKVAQLPALFPRSLDDTSSLVLITIISAYGVSEIMKVLSMRLLACSLLTAICFNSGSAQVCRNSSTAIGGKPFPPLIEATTEDLITGLESGLFTSVDLVNVSYLASTCLSALFLGSIWIFHRTENTSIYL